MVVTVSPTRTDELIQCRLGLGHRSGGCKEPCIKWEADPPGKGAILEGDNSRLTVRYTKHPACGRTGRYSQPYSVGGSSDAAFLLFVVQPRVYFNYILKHTHVHTVHNLPAFCSRRARGCQAAAGPCWRVPTCWPRATD